MDVGKLINSNTSVLGKDLLEWIKADKSTKTEEEHIVSMKLYRKYVVDQDGQPKNKVFPEVYYYVNHNNRFNKDLYLAYIVRDKTKSPRKIPDSLKELDIFASEDSYKGSLIQEWAYFQNGNPSNTFYMEGCDIVTKYLESDCPIRRNVYYFVTKSHKGVIKVFRDTNKSPRQYESEEL